MGKYRLIASFGQREVKNRKVVQLEHIRKEEKNILIIKLNNNCRSIFFLIKKLNVRGFLLITNDV